MIKSTNGQKRKRELKISSTLSSRPNPICFETPKDYLLYQATKGAEERYGIPLSTEIQQRLDLELRAVEEAGITPQIAMLHEQIVKAKQQGVLIGNGRGTAPSSLLLYLLGITRVDPLKHGLLFERFLNPDTPTKVSIDIEVSERGTLPQRKEDHPYTLLYDSDAIKIGWLTLSHLTWLQDRMEQIKHRLGKEIQLEAIPTNDPDTLQSIGNERGGRCYLLQAPRLQQLWKEIKPDSFNDLMLSIATLYSKGQEIAPTYIARKQGKEPINYLLPVIEPYLSETYGITLYQEQIMQLAQAIANFSPGESDRLRLVLYRGLTDESAKMRSQFLVGGQEKGYDKRILEKVWSEWVRVAPLTVNKSHIVGATLLAYQMSYLNTHYPVE